MVSRDKAHINAVFIGHVDAGKSTTFNHLVNKEIKEKEEKKKNPVQFQWYLGKMKVDRERQISIDLSYKKLETSKHQFTVIDAPGHRDFIRNTIIGISQADVAIMMIGSPEGEFEAGFSNQGQTKEHALLAYTLGVNQMIICCNKIDDRTVNFSQDRYNCIKLELSKYLKQVGFKIDDIPFIPVSGFKGDNMTEKSINTPWYEGPTLLEALNNVKAPKRLSDKPLRIPIYALHKICGVGTVAVGRVVTGVMKPGMILQFSPSNIQSECKSIEFHHEPLVEAIPGDFVGFCLRGVSVKDIHRGYVASDSKNDPAKAVYSFQAQIIVLNHPNKIYPGYTPAVHCHTAIVSCKFETLHEKINTKTGITEEVNPKFLKRGDCALVTLVPTKQFCCETFQDFPLLGKFAIRDMRETVAVGIIKKITQIEEK